MKNDTLRTVTSTLKPMLRGLLALVGSAACCAPPAIAQNVVRGAVPGWPGNTAYYAPQNVYQYAAQQPVVQVQANYAPQPGYSAYYAPAAQSRIAYAVPAVGSYQVSYAGANQPGVATTAYYGGYSAPVQRVAYMPQQVYYRPVAPVTYYRPATPVTYYRPVTVYQPVAGGVALQNCNYAATTQVSSCQTSSCGSSGWRPFAWLWGGNCSNNSNTCYKSCAPQQCGQTAVPYYTTPVIPTVPAPTYGTPAPPYRPGSIISPGTVPAPPTRLPGTITSEPASTAPRITPGTTIPSNPGTITTPFNPGGPPPSSGFGTPANPGFGQPVEGYRPIIDDPYRQPATSSSNYPPSNNPSSNYNPSTSPMMMNPPAAPLAPVIGSGYRTEASQFNDRTNLTAPANQPNTIRQPTLLAPPSSVQPLSDPHGNDRREPANRAPQLLNPSDRTAAVDQRWAVVPAVWPARNNSAAQPVAAAPIAPQQPFVPVAAPMQLDDSGWKSAR